jgi:plasmid stabilization system protein ParE
MNYKILWTDEAIRNLEQILNYIATNWTEKEVSNFKINLSEQLNIISKFPNIFPASAITPRLRKAVLTKQTIIFYEVK